MRLQPIGGGWVQTLNKDISSIVSAATHKAQQVIARSHGCLWTEHQAAAGMDVSRKGRLLFLAPLGLSLICCLRIPHE